MERAQFSTGARHRLRGGFTLIELLVVISIIALLIGILLPALGAARNAARTAVCLANIRSAGQAMATYAASNKDFLAGPNTSGVEMGTNNWTFYRESATYPLQNLDWVSPTMGDALGLPGDACDKYERMFLQEFRCPSNSEFYTTITNPPPGCTISNPEELFVASYSAALGFHLVPTATESGQVSADNATTKLTPFVDYPKTYAPRIDRVGAASSKIYALEGVRFLGGANDFTFNGFARQIQGGNFMVRGPWASFGNDPFERDQTTLELTEEAVKYAYRHNEQMNTAYFDGHAENETDQSVVDFTKYFPSGTIMKNASFTYHKSGEDGPMR